MGRDRRRGFESRSRSRRGFLFKLGGGAAVALTAGAGLLSTGSFDVTAIPRGSAIGVASEGNGIVGLTPQGTVKKNQRDPMVLVENNGSQQLRVTVSLDDCTDGGLYDNEDESDVCTVEFTLESGNAQFVDISATATGTIPYSVDVEAVTNPAEFQLTTSGQVEALAGNAQGAISIQHPTKDNDFSANPPGNGNQGNDFGVRKVDIRDNDGDDDLDRIEFTVREVGSGGTIVGTFVEDNPPGNRYSPGGNPAVTIEPNAGYTIQSGTAYSLTIRAEDADGNFATETVEDTA